MEKNSLVWLGLFISVAIAELSAEAIGSSTLVFCTKPLLMPVLAMWLARNTPGIRRFLRNTLFAGLIFSTAGDVLMMLATGDYATIFFLMGVGAFLCTHLCYIGGFISEVRLERGFLSRRPLGILPFLLFLVGFLYWLWPGIPEGMQLPVAVYAAVLSAMTLSVLNMRQHVAQDVLQPMLAGALLFMLSDCLIAVLKFGQHFPAGHIAVMVTYILGQWLIIRGAATQLRRFPEKKTAVY